MASELKPCPFCKSLNCREILNKVYCAGCGVIGEFTRIKTNSELDTAWNTRADGGGE